MKRLLPAIILLFTIGTASAQIGKGHYYLGGSINYNYDEAGTTSIVNYPQGVTTYNDGRITNFQIDPDFGFFLSDKWAIGIQLGYSRYSHTITNAYVANDTTSRSYTSVNNYHTDFVGFGIHLRYYWMLSSKIGIFPQFGFSTANDLNDFNSGTLSVGGSPNIVFFATPHLGITMGYGNIAYTLDYKSKTSNFNLGLNTNIGFGLNYYWGK